MKRNPLYVFLCAMILFQAGILFWKYSPDLLAIRSMLSEPAFFRGANFSQGQRFAGFIRFLVENIPSDSQVVLPPAGSGPKGLSVTPYMQFFLFPRQVINCLDLDCYLRLSREGNYILVASKSQSSLFIDQPDRLRMYDETWGVIIPEHLSANPVGVITNVGNTSELVMSAFWPITWLFLLALTGCCWVRRLLPGRSVGEGLALGYGIALGAFSLCCATASLINISLDKTTFVGITAILVTLTVLVSLPKWRNHPMKSGHTWADIRRLASFDKWQIIIFFLGGITAFIGVGMGYHTTDEIQIWGLKGYGIAETGSIKTVMQWGTNTLPYPLHIPILIAAFKAMFEETLPASKLIFSGYYLGLLIILYNHFIRHRVARTVAGLATLLLATTPIFFVHATIAYANLPFCYYMVVAVLLLHWAQEIPERRGVELALFVSSIFFSAGAWTRPEGIWMAWLGVLVGVVNLKRNRLFSLRRVIFMVMPLLLYSIFWLVIMQQVYRDAAARADLPVNAVRQIMAGFFHLKEAWFVLVSLLTRMCIPATWGVLGLSLLVLVIFSIIRPSYHRPSWLLFGVGLGYTGMVAGIYYLASFDTVHDVSWWVSTGFDRMMLPGFILLWSWGISGVNFFYDGVFRPGAFHPKDWF